MRNVPKSIVSRSQQIGCSIPYSHFVCLINPKMQGPNWNWNTFVDFAVRMTNASCYQAFTDKEWSKWEKEIRQIATSIAKIHAEQIIKDSGVLEWDIKESS
jgi:hypothetical protein